MNDIRFVYGQKPWRVLLAILFMAGLAVGMGWIARHNDEGLLINGFIELSPGDATIFFWVLTALVAVAAVLGVASLLFQLGHEREVVLGRDALLAPGSVFSRQSRTIPYRSITGTEIRAIQGQLFLYVFSDAKKLVLAASQLPDKHAFAELVSELDARVAAVQPQRT